MTVPMTRIGSASTYENDPVGFFTGQVTMGNQLEGWICRHDAPRSGAVAQWTAGADVTLGFNFGVNHVGFCDGHVSYDVGATRREMRWIKISNWLDCGGSNELSMVIPPWLKSGRAVFRWSWTALHHFPDIEVFVQCAEVSIASANSELPSGVAGFYLIDPQLYPRDGHDGVGYEDPYNGAVKDRVVGAPCGLADWPENECPLTAPGTAGYIDPFALRSYEPTVSRAPTRAGNPTPVPTPIPAAPSSPTPRPTHQPNAQCSRWRSNQAPHISHQWCADTCAWSVYFCTYDGFCYCEDDGTPPPTAASCWASTQAPHVPHQWCVDTCAWSVPFCTQDGFCVNGCDAAPARAPTRAPAPPTPTPTRRPTPDATGCTLWKSTNLAIASDQWCVATCAWDVAFCLKDGYCECASSETPQPTAMPVPTLEPSAAPTRSPVPTPKPTARPTAVPTPFAPTRSPIPTPKPTAAPTHDAPDAFRMCYFTNWARYRQGLVNNGKDIFENGFDAALCTHMAYGFGTIDKDTFEVKSWDSFADLPTGSSAAPCPAVCEPGYEHDWSTGSNPCQWPCDPNRLRRGFEGMTGYAKRVNPEMKALFSLGGWNFNDCGFGPWSGAHFLGGTGYETCEIFHDIAGSEANSRRFAQHAIDFLRLWGFDGLDIDWEYPVAVGHNQYSGNPQSPLGPSTPEDYANYVRMLRVIREEFEAEAARTARERLLITAAVGIGKQTVDQSYNITGMNEYLDIIALMTYDMHGGWEQVTNFHAPLHATAADAAFYDNAASVAWAVDYWLDNGADASKLLMGLGAYGRGWYLQDPNNRGVLAPTNGVCARGISTGQEGYLAYYEILDLIDNGATKHYDSEREVPYIVTNDGQWIGYDDPQSLTAKLNFMKSRNLRGAMIWAADLDMMPSFPLLNLVRSEMADYRPLGNA